MIMKGWEWWQILAHGRLHQEHQCQCRMYNKRLDKCVYIGIHKQTNNGKKALECCLARVLYVQMSGLPSSLLIPWWTVTCGSPKLIVFIFLGMKSRRRSSCQTPMSLFTKWLWDLMDRILGRWLSGTSTWCVQVQRPEFDSFYPCMKPCAITTVKPTLLQKWSEPETHRPARLQYPV